MGTTITLTAGTQAPFVITGDGVYSGCTYDKLTGWYGTPHADLGLVKRPQAPGSFAPAQTFPDELSVSIDGQYFGSDRRDALLMREALSALYNEGLPVTMTVADDLRTTSRQVLVERVTVPWTIHKEFNFSIDMKAADPRRYGDAVVTSTGLAAAGTGLVWPIVWPVDWGTIGVNGRLTISNPGNTETTPRYVVSGGSMPDGFDIVNVATGERLSYVAPVADNTTVELDTATRSATINGTGPASRFLASPQWWAVPPRTTLDIQFLARGAYTGTPLLTASTSPAFY